ncbi:MAG TPA: alpha/beta hydrolase [Acidimicrobiia bacterium]|nr:alpha/beta hydrolase [Acidimicrobiia bacterium]
MRALFGAALIALMGAFLWALSIATGVEAAETIDPHLTAPGRILNVGDLAVHIREEGAEGQPAVLLLHDFDVAGGYQWLGVTELFEGYRIVIPDLVGFGYSSRLEDMGRPHTVIGRAENLALLLERLEIESSSVIGAGYGGVVAAQLAALRPDLVENLVLVSPEIFGPPPSWYRFLHGWPVLGEAYNFTAHGASRSASNRYAAGCEDGGWCPDGEALAEREVTARVRGTTAAFNAFGSTPAATTLPGALSSIAAPTLVLWGAHDDVTPLSDGEDVAAAIPGASLSVIPGTGHRPHLEEPAVTTGLIIDFLAG